MTKKRIAHITDRYDKARGLFDDLFNLLCLSGVSLKASKPNLTIETDSEFHRVIAITDENSSFRLRGMRFDKVFVDETGKLDDYTKALLTVIERPQ